MTLTFAATVADRAFDMQLNIAEGETIAVLGPNGAGKSTLVNILAGLLRPDTGYATLAGKQLFDLGSGAATWTPPHDRGVSMLAQTADLFPHLSVLENVAFSSRSRGMRKAASHQIARRWLTEVDCLEFADRRPAELSGGQAQRVAIARALASDPRLLLLDEPLAALDIAVAPVIRRTLLRVLQDRTAIIITHDILDALTLADRVVVIADGKIIEHGPARETLDHPRTPFTAGLAALNLFTGTLTTQGMKSDTGISITSVTTTGRTGSRVAATIRPAAVRITTRAGDDGVANKVSGTILDLEPRGDLIRVRSDIISADLTPAEVADANLTTGTTVEFSFRPEDVSIYAAHPLES